MKVQCKNCLPKEGIDIPNFTQSDKDALMKLRLDSPIHTVKYIIDNFKISPVIAKYITTHINVNNGHCNNCIFDQLDKEYIQCPKCGALNFNWKLVNGNELKAIRHDKNITRRLGDGAE